MKTPLLDEAPGEDPTERRNIEIWQRISKRPSWPAIFMLLSLLILGMLLFKIVTLPFINETFDNEEVLKRVSVSVKKEAQTKDANVCHWMPDSWKIDCYPTAYANRERCLARGCCWAIAEMKGAPYCYFPEGFSYYMLDTSNRSEDGVTVYLDKVQDSPYPNNSVRLQADFSFQTTQYLRLTIRDAEQTRFEIPYLPNFPKQDVPYTDYSIRITSPDGIQIIRRKTGTVIFDTRIGPLVYSNQFLQLSTMLPTGFVYGLGEHRDSLLHSLDWQKFTLFSADHVPQEKQNLYGSHPFYLVVEDDGSAHGVLLYNSNAMDVLIQPVPAITFRTIGGVLDFHVFLGSDPADVIRQYTSVVGRPFLPPYWSLGFHLCRFQYRSVNRTREIWQRTRQAQIPFDVQWNDIDYMDKQRDFTVGKSYEGLGEFVQDIHSVGMHYIPIVDCGITCSETDPAYNRGLELDVFIQNSDGKGPFIGKVWPGETVWPDFTSPNATIYWTEQFEKFHDVVEYDGAWIDMNEPSNFIDGSTTGCPSNNLEKPPYVPAIAGGKLAYKTLCMSARQYVSRHYDLHSLYGLTETMATNQALRSVRKKRPFVISRSTFVGQGYYGGHWTGDNEATWYDMSKSIPAILNFNMFGIPMVGADICGFNGNTTPPLCQRWMELGAFYPFSRNHNTDDGIDQDPVALGPDIVKASLNALTWRYRLLPYLYTLFYRAHVYGDTVARPLFFESVHDHLTYEIDDQFLWGPGLMIIPVLEESVTLVRPYFPQGVWYLLHAGVTETVLEGGEFHSVPIALEEIGLALRGGYILPTQEAKTTTTESRKTKFSLLIGLNETSAATGELYWDDGDTLDTYENDLYNLISFSVQTVNKVSQLSSQCQHCNYKQPMALASVIIHGVKAVPGHVQVNTIEWKEFQYSSETQTLAILDLTLDLKDTFSIKWH